MDNIRQLQEFVGRHGVEALRVALRGEVGWEYCLDRILPMVDLPNVTHADFPYRKIHETSSDVGRFIYSKWLMIERELLKMGDTKRPPNWPFVWRVVRQTLRAVLSSNARESS